MNSTQQACLIGMIANRYQVDVNLLSFQNNCGAAGNELADATCPEAPADDASKAIVGPVDGELIDRGFRWSVACPLRIGTCDIR
jgi:hypothetical protein